VIATIIEQVVVPGRPASLRAIEPFQVGVERSSSLYGGWKAMAALLPVAVAVMALKHCWLRCFLSPTTRCSSGHICRPAST